MDRYVFRNLIIAATFVTLVLTVLVLLTQSLKFLEIVMEAGASGLAFWALTMLALPRFLEVIIPIGLMAAVLFVYNRLTLDSELIVMRALGFSPLRLARPALVLALGLTGFLFLSVSWLAPVATATLLQKRVALKAQISTLLFREGVFNQVGDGLMVYVRERGSDGEMRGLIIHDARDKKKPPSTVIANRGVIVTSEGGNQVLVYDGSRQSFNERDRVLQRLNFDQYTVELPEEQGPLRQRWHEPEERTLRQLFHPDLSDKRDRENRRELFVEIHKRMATPFLVLSFTFIALSCLLLGPVNRRGQSLKILIAIGCMIMVEVLFLSMFSLAKQAFAGIPLMYLVAVSPVIVCFILLRRPEHIKAPEPVEAAS